MLEFCHGANLERLADHLIKHLKNNPLDQPLAEEIFVVQNYGMGRWLSMHMAERKSIAANLRFEFPAERIWKLYRLIDPDIPTTLPSDRYPLAFSIMQLLGSGSRDAIFDPLWDYIEEEDTNTEQLRMWKLSNRIADVFDQYLVYRPEMLLKWEENKLETDHSSERWQAELWRKLIQEWKKNQDKRGNAWIHRGELQSKLYRYIDKNLFEISDLPERITVFGVSTLPPAFVKSFVKLSKLVDVSFYWLAPVKNSSSTNTLIDSLGKEGIEFLNILQNEISKDQDVQNQFQSRYLEKNQGAGETLLQRIQTDIISDSAPDTGITVAADESIRVHSCHSPMREVEVLYNQLLDMFDKNPSLSPDEVVVMTPDIETYAPLIDAVFGTDEEGVPEIPFSIADRGFRNESPVADIFLRLLNLLQSRFKVTELMELLESDAIRKALDISDDELNLIQQWIGDNRIRWGIDSDFRRKQGLPETDNFTWKKGLMRLLLGYAMYREDEDQIYDGKLPYSQLEGASQAELAGKLSHFLHALFEYYDKASAHKTVAEHCQFCYDILDEFFPDDPEYGNEISQIRQQIDQLREYIDASGFDTSVPFPVIRSLLSDLLENSQSGGGYLGYGVTFCALVPMRSIPFKAVGLLGMNEGAFPRRRPPIEFDLMRTHPKPGDRSRSDDDRYMFLETLISAQKQLLISYVGQSNVQDTRFPPSVIVSELLHVLDEEYRVDPEKIVTEHRLQAFSKRYFDSSDSELFSYAKSQLEISRLVDAAPEDPDVFINKPLPEADEEWRTISIGDLISFFQQPVRYFMQQRLAINLQEIEVLTEEREPFDMDGLTRYHIRQQMLERYLKGRDPATYREVASAGDMLPVGFPGAYYFSQQLREVRDFGRELSAILNQQPKPDIEIDLDLAPFRLKGKLASIYENGQWLYRFGSLRSKDRIELWIKHLAYLAATTESDVPISGIVTSSSGSVELEMLGNTGKPAIKILRDLVTLFWRGFQQPLSFFPDTSYNYAANFIDKNKEPDEAASSAYGAGWKNDFVSYPMEGDDPYNRLFVRDVDPTADTSFRKLALDFWRPFLAAVKEEL